jgi:NADH dehydrogenase
MSERASAAGRAATAVEDAPQPLASMRGHFVLVTGAAGFVGTHVCRELTHRGARVRGLVHSPAKAAQRLASLPVELHVGDIRDEQVLRRAMQGCDMVVHLVAIAIERRGQRYDEINARGTQRVVDAMRAAGVRRLVHMSQNHAASDSPYPFLRSKGLAEDAVRASGLEWTVLRPSVIFGPEDEFVDDVARTVALALERPATDGRAYALGGPAQLSLRQMTERVLVAMDAKRLLIPLPTAVLRPLIAIAQRVLPSPPVTTGLLDLLAIDNVVQGDALRTDFGLVPIPFAPEELEYLRAVRLRDALRSLIGR